ncbi:hypothetical protein [Variovorax paradoxus]|uniref:hypothetical protein n=1 Tax=Variovorax paradoxus TaxID=34073 RepID=UPI00193169CB|nr:hypothetical protein INQ48_18175 [Variovorax paradoxus]
MSTDRNTLRKLARECEVEVIEYPDGRVLVVGGLVNVHWWPDSKRKTAFVEGAPAGRRYATARNVINLATKGVA